METKEKYENLRAKYALDHIQKEMSEILPFLYLGGSAAANSQDFFNTTGVKWVLNVAKEQPRSPFAAKYKKISLNDSLNENISNHFAEACEFIDEARKANEKVLVHCAAGISRSATIVASYLMNRYGHSAEEALNFIRRKRHQIDPNFSFVVQLFGLEASCRN